MLMQHQETESGPAKRLVVVPVCCTSPCSASFTIPSLAIDTKTNSTLSMLSQIIFMLPVSVTASLTLPPSCSQTPACLLHSYIYHFLPPLQCCFEPCTSISAPPLQSPDSQHKCTNVSVQLNQSGWADTFPESFTKLTTVLNEILTTHSSVFWCPVFLSHICLCIEMRG